MRKASRAEFCCKLLLLGGDGETYAVAQGALSIGGFTAGQEARAEQRCKKIIPTSARSATARLWKKRVPTQIVQKSQIDLLLREPDFTTSARMAYAMNEVFCR
jgi:flagellar P-ring protein precursor FlgI